MPHRRQEIDTGRWRVILKKILVEEQGPSVARRVIPANPGASGERGNLAEIAARLIEDSVRGGWGVWLTPAHCHSERGNATGRVERYREAVIEVRAPRPPRIPPPPIPMVVPVTL
jgi:hypothetical protein